MLRAESDSPDRSSDSATPEAIERQIDPDIEDVVMQDVEDDFEQMRDGSDGADSSPMDTPDEDGPDRTDYVSKLATGLNQGNKKFLPRPKTKAFAAERGVRNRMFEDIEAPKPRMSKERFYTFNFGHDLDDLYPILRSRDIWHLNPRDVVLPSRKSIREALKLEAAGKYIERRQVAEEIEQRSSTADAEGLVKPNDGLNRQKTQRLEDEDAADRMFWNDAIPNEAVTGRRYEAQKHRLEPLQSLDLAQAAQLRAAVSSSYSEGVFSVLSPPRRKGRPRKQPDQSSKDASKAPAETYHQGWLVNLGARPQCLAWAPVKSDGQYLAVSFKCSTRQREAAPQSATKTAPAFSSSPDYPSHIQIWRMKASSGDAEAPARFSHDLSCAPHLLQRLCMKVGNIIRFEWLPLSPNSTPPSTHRSMVILSSDGNVRLITIDLSAHGTSEISQPRLIARPPSHTIFTCFTLPSYDDMIAGGADGAVRLYNLCEHSADGELQPYTTIQIHNTYIMNIAVATDLPHYLASNSANGETILTDLRSPLQDRVRLQKSRLPTRNLLYHPHTRVFLSTSDASGSSERHGTSLSTVVGHNLRHFYHSITLMKLPEASGIATVIACSPFHPIILAANASGSVFATNILRRLLPTSFRDVTGGGFMLKLYEVDWIPLPKETSENETTDALAGANEQSDQIHGATEGTSMKQAHRFISDSAEVSPEQPKPKPGIDIFHGADTRPGITRFHEGFKPERIELSTSGQEVTGKKEKGKNKDQRKTDDTPSTASYQIICHEEQAVTAMAWNGNGRFAGWAAIAWGSGILRIQDLSHGE